MDGWFRRTLAIGEPVSRHVGGLSLRDVGVPRSQLVVSNMYVVLLIAKRVKTTREGPLLFRGYLS